MLKKNSHSINILFFLSLFFINNPISAVEPLTTATMFTQSAAAAKALFILASKIASGTITGTVPTAGQAGALGLSMLTGMYAIANYPVGNQAQTRLALPQQAEQKEFVLPRNVREHLGLEPRTQTREENLPRKSCEVVSEQPTETNNIQEKKSVLEEKSLQETETTHLQEGKESDQEREKKKKQYALMGALVRSDLPISPDNGSSSNFHLPGEKIPVSNIPAVKGSIVGAGNQMLVSDVAIPGFGHGNFIMEVRNNPPIALANHQGYQQPVVYPPSEKGQLLRLTNVTIPNVGNGDLILFVPHALLEEASAEHARQTLATEQKTSAAQKAQVVLADKFHGKLDSKLASVLGVGAGLATTGIAELSLAGSSVILSGPICVPVIVGGAAVYVIIRVGKLFGVWRQKKRVAREQEFSKQLWEACQQKVSPHFQEQIYNACVNGLPQESPTQCGTGSLNPPMPEPQSCGHTNPPMPKPADCGHTIPNSKPVEGAACEQGGQAKNLITECNSAQSSQMPPLFGGPLGDQPLIQSQDQFLFAKLIANEVNRNLKDILTDNNYEPIDQDRIDHVETGHTKTGNRVNADPNKPKTLFDDFEKEFCVLVGDTIKNGSVSLTDQFAIEYDFKRAIGKTTSGEVLTKVRVVRFLNPATGKFKIVSMYPIQ